MLQSSMGSPKTSAPYTLKISQVRCKNDVNLKQCERIKIEFSGELVPGAARLNSLSAVAMFDRKEPEYAEINPLGMCPTVPPSKK